MYVHDSEMQVELLVKIVLGSAFAHKLQFFQGQFYILPPIDMITLNRWVFLIPIAVITVLFIEMMSPGGHPMYFPGMPHPHGPMPPYQPPSGYDYMHNQHRPWNSASSVQHMPPPGVQFGPSVWHSRPDGHSRTEGLVRPDGLARPEGMPRPEGLGRPDGMPRPEGLGRPEGMSRPEGLARPDAVHRPDALPRTDGQANRKRRRRTSSISSNGGNSDTGYTSGLSSPVHISPEQGKLLDKGDNSSKTKVPSL